MRKWHNVFGLLSGIAVLIGLNFTTKGDMNLYFIRILETIVVGMGYFVYQAMRNS